MARFQRDVEINYKCDTCEDTGTMVFLLGIEVLPAHGKFTQNVVNEFQKRDDLFSEIPRSNMIVSIAACEKCLYGKIAEAIKVVGENLATLTKNEGYRMRVAYGMGEPTILFESMDIDNVKDKESPV